MTIEYTLSKVKKLETSLNIILFKADELNKQELKIYHAYLQAEQNARKTINTIPKMQELLKGGLR